VGPNAAIRTMVRWRENPRDREGELLLLDVWAKKKTPAACITTLRGRVSEHEGAGRVRESVHIVREARDKAVKSESVVVAKENRCRAGKWTMQRAGYQRRRIWQILFSSHGPQHRRKRARNGVNMDGLGARSATDCAHVHID